MLSIDFGMFSAILVWKHVSVVWTLTFLSLSLSLSPYIYIYVYIDVNHKGWPLFWIPLPRPLYTHTATDFNIGLYYLMMAWAQFFLSWILIVVPDCKHLESTREARVLRRVCPLQPHATTIHTTTPREVVFAYRVNIVCVLSSVWFVGVAHCVLYICFCFVCLSCTYRMCVKLCLLRCCCTLRVVHMFCAIRGAKKGLTLVEETSPFWQPSSIEVLETLEFH